VSVTTLSQYFAPGIGIHRDETPAKVGEAPLTQYHTASSSGRTLNHASPSHHASSCRAAFATRCHLPAAIATASEVCFTTEPTRSAAARINYFAFALERACSVAMGLLNRLILQFHARFFFNNPTFPADGAARQKLGKLVARPRIKSIARRAAVLGAV
jgi:hypothetical protein